MDHGLRRRRLVERLGGLGVEAMLLSTPANVRYLSGFTGSHGRLLVAGGESVLLTDGRYAEQATREAPGLELIVSQTGLAAPALERARRLGVSRLGFEGAATYREFTRLADAADGVELIAVNGAVEGLRRAKDAEEIAALERAQSFADAALRAVVEMVREGMTERELGLRLEVAMRRAGADGVAFDPIVAFGEHAAEPHHAPCERPLLRGDVVTVDFGALSSGYHSDMTRTLSLGQPPEELRRIHAAVLDAHLRGVAAVAPGRAAADVDRAARSVLDDAGYGERFVHPTGHGVGLEIHEDPFLRTASQEELPEDAVVTVEPGVYVPGLGGVRIEDMVVVAPAGPRVLATSTKELTVL
jgi:Xaa-Pro aminopeptidase